MLTGIGTVGSNQGSVTACSNCGVSIADGIVAEAIASISLPSCTNITCQAITTVSPQKVLNYDVAESQYELCDRGFDPNRTQ